MFNHELIITATHLLSCAGTDRAPEQTTHQPKHIAAVKKYFPKIN